MDPTGAFQPQDKCYKITSATVPGPAPIQIGGPANSLMQVMVYNDDATNTAFLVYGPTSAACAASAAALPGTGTPQTMIPIKAASWPAITLTFPANTWFTTVCAAGTPVVYLTVGQGKL